MRIFLVIGIAAVGVFYTPTPWTTARSQAAETHPRTAATPLVDLDQLEPPQLHSCTRLLS